MTCLSQMIFNAYFYDQISVVLKHNALQYKDEQINLMIIFDTQDFYNK